MSFDAKLEIINSFKEPAEIAEYLVEFGGMAGRAGAYDSCPIAKYFGTEFESVWVCDKWIPWGNLTPGGFHMHVYVNEQPYKLSPTVREFIEQFDDGQYPELEID